MKLVEWLIKEQEETQRLDDLEIEQEIRRRRILNGRCPRHPQYVISNGMFDAPCGACEE